jgi:hypothetical protein
VFIVVVVVVVVVVIIVVVVVVFVVVYFVIDSVRKRFDTLSYSLPKILISYFKMTFLSSIP